VARVSTIQRSGARFYVNRESRQAVPGVTSIIDVLGKPFLTNWAAKTAAEAAVDNLPAVTLMAETDRQAAIDFIKGAHRRYSRKRAEIGSRAHDMFERMIRGESVTPDRDLVPYYQHFSEFLDVVQPELIRAEDVAWSDTHSYAGSFDALLRVDGLTVIADWKTSRNAYPQVSLQMAAYGHAETLIDPDGNTDPMPHVDGAFVLHITDEKWEWRPVDYGPEVFSVFLALREAFEWQRETAPGAIGSPVARGGSLVTGTQRRV